MACHVVVQQPALPKYRVPVFRELASRAGIELSVLYASAPGSPPNAEPEGFAARHVPMRVLGRGRFVLYWHDAQWSSATKRRCDTLVLSWNSRYVSLLPTLVRARISGVRVVLWGHGYSKNEKIWSSGIRNIFAGLSDATLFYDATTAERFAAGKKRSKAYVAPNALDQEPIQAARQAWKDTPALARFQRDQNLDPAATFLYVSRVEPANRLDLLVRALPRLIHRAPSVRVVVVGKGGRSYVDELKELAKREGVDEALVFTGPIYDEASLAPYFLSSAAFVYPANIGLSLLHAFGYGLPVVTSDRRDTQNPEIVALEHEVNGLTYRHGDPGALADTLARLLSDDDFRRSLAQAAHETATRRFNLKAMVDGMEAAIRGSA